MSVFGGGRFIVCRTIRSVKCQPERSRQQSPSEPLKSDLGPPEFPSNKPKPSRGKRCGSAGCNDFNWAAQQMVTFNTPKPVPVLGTGGPHIVSHLSGRQPVGNGKRDWRLSPRLWSRSRSVGPRDGPARFQRLPIHRVHQSEKKSRMYFLCLFLGYFRWKIDWLLSQFRYEQTTFWCLSIDHHHMAPEWL